MVDAQSVGEAFANPPEDLGVRRLENLGDLDTHTRERRHGEESAVIELGRFVFPEAKFVGLTVMHRPDAVDIGPCGSGA